MSVGLGAQEVIQVVFQLVILNNDLLPELLFIIVTFMHVFLNELMHKPFHHSYDILCEQFLKFTARIFLLAHVRTTALFPGPMEAQ